MPRRRNMTSYRTMVLRSGSISETFEYNLNVNTRIIILDQTNNKIHLLLKSSVLFTPYVYATLIIMVLETE